ncbi:hypothetical protein SSX86_024960 [Deinandra increscens subsp. villosa]|uniref:DNA helicase Pif1-like 2B domain-containing protein n=1 Tax=Deinandra increscens subsp. villosa TaxID=3103831 RepID=A0AAP0CGZ7_9ASTR
MRLHENMRLSRSPLNSIDRVNAQAFCDWILSIGDGLAGGSSAGTTSCSKIVDIPDRFLLTPPNNTLLDLIKFIYDDDFLRNPDVASVSDRRIVCPKNKTADAINNMVLDLFPGGCVTYRSTDSMIPHSQSSVNSDLIYPSEYLNLLNFPGIPPHELILKENSPIMLLHNINQSSGLCNGTRLVVSNLLEKTIEARVLTGTSVGSKVYIPRIDFVHNKKNSPSFSNVDSFMFEPVTQ